MKFFCFYNLNFDYFYFEIKLLPNNNRTSLWIGRIILKCEKTISFLCFWTCKYKMNLSRKNSRTSRTENLNFFQQTFWPFYFYSHLKCIPWTTWTFRCFHYELLSHFYVYVELHAIEGRMSGNINSEPCMKVHVNFLQQIWVFYILRTSLLFLFQFLSHILRKKICF